MKKYLVTTTFTKVETWEVEAENEDEAALNFEEGELVSEDMQREVNEAQKIEG
jgi:hypothetical protein